MFIPQETIVAVVLIYLLTYIFSIWGIKSSYHNGVNDGYGFSKEKDNPGYKCAGDYLKNNMSHR